MSVVLESRMLRDFLHRLVDNLLDDFESKATSPTRPAVISPTPRAGIAKPSITLEPTGKKAAQKPKADPPVSCKKMRGTNPAIKCAACQKATATVECSRCPTLLCDGCWETHVRVHWHTAVTSKPPVGNVADLKE